MSNFFTIKKTVPGDIYLELHSINNDQQSRLVVLTDKMSTARLQKDYAMWIFFDSTKFNMYKKGYFTFEDNEAAVQTAIAEGLYFDEKLNFKPATDDSEKEILEILESGSKERITGLLKRTAEDIVLSVAVKNRDNLTSGTIRLIEQITKQQIMVDEQ